MFDRPEEKIKQLEKKVNELIEESCFASSRGEFQVVSFMAMPTSGLVIFCFFS